MDRPVPRRQEAHKDNDHEYARSRGKVRAACMHVSANIQQKKNYARSQICLSSHVWTLFCTLLISMSPAFGIGASSIFNSNVVLQLSRISLEHDTTISLLSLTSLNSHHPNLLLRSPVLQRSLRYPDFNSKMLLAHASNYRPEANVPKAHMDQSGRGTYHVSLI